MERIIICPKCNGNGYITHANLGVTWSEHCEACNGKGIIENRIDTAAIGDYLVCITKKEYEELLEYKHMYEALCE